MTSQPATTIVQDLADFIEACPTPYHAARECERRLARVGFERLDERDPWAIRPGMRAVVRRGGGTLLAFQVGERPPSEAGFLVLGAHTDSPNLRLKPRPRLESVNHVQLGVEIYGAPLWHTWLDRDLSIAGRVVLRDGTTRLVRLPGAPCSIPSLAIHLDRTVNTEGLKLNAEEHLRPLVEVGLGAGRGVLDWIAEALGANGDDAIEPRDIVASDLMLFDVQPPSLGGPAGELLHASRIDNLASCHAVVTALAAAKSRALTQVIFLGDHEEVGSESAHGALSRFLLGVLERLEPEVARAVARSLLISVDMAHAIHPGHADRHDSQHRPELGGGPVVKVNASQRYATDAPARAVFVEACRAAGFEPQYFAGRNDVLCGTTIGPLASARTGMRAVDVGNPMLSMHSCRETAHARDVQPMIDALTGLLDEALPPDPAD